MRFVLTVGTSVFSFTPVGDEAGPYPFLVSVGGIHSTARAGAPSGFGATDTPSASVTLLNQNKRVALMVGDPLRAKADIYDNSDRLAFSGTVSNIDYGLEMTFQLES
jgi:hypothetical protein